MYFLLIFIFPCILLSFISIVGFAIPAEGGERISLTMSVLLSFLVFLVVLNDLLPRSSNEAPLLAIYIVIVIILTKISLLCSIFVVSLRDYREQISTGVSRLCLQLLAAMICMKEAKIVRNLQWKFIVRVLDRFLIYLFLLLISVLTFTVFVVIPIMKR